jgi:hypothetical protein
MDLKVPSILFVVLIMLIAEKGRAWDVDFSHHQSQEAQQKFTAPAHEAAPASESEYVSTVHKNQNEKFPRQEIVILNTEKGFVPNDVPLHKGQHYRVHVVNINESRKNLSFVLDGFDRHEATYYGQIKTFDVDPEREGVFEFECPETTSLGKVVVFGPKTTTDVHRTISSQ